MKEQALAEKRATQEEIEKKAKIEERLKQLLSPAMWKQRQQMKTNEKKEEKVKEVLPHPANESWRVPKFGKKKKQGQ